MPTILDRIVATKREEIAAAKSVSPESALRGMLGSAPPVRDFQAAVAAQGPIKLIAEVKKASPSRGVIRADFHHVDIARDYERNGAACLSVLTDESYFQGHLDFLREIRECVGLPILRKDFMIDGYQLVEARLAGADAVLLIAECLDDVSLRRMIGEARDLGMTPLVEFYEPANLPRVLEAGATLVGVNNRDLRTFQVDLQHTIRMRRQVPVDCLLVGESGIRSRADALQLERAGVNAILVGEHLMAQDDIGAAVRALLGAAEV